MTHLNFRCFGGSLLTLLFLVASAQSSRADIINLATGLDASNSLISTGGQPDAHWNVDQPGGGTGPAQTVFPGDPDYI